MVEMNRKCPKKLELLDLKLVNGGVKGRRELLKPLEWEKRQEASKTPGWETPKTSEFEVTENPKYEVIINPGWKIPQKPGWQMPGIWSLRARSEYRVGYVCETVIEDVLTNILK